MVLCAGERIRILVVSLPASGGTDDRHPVSAAGVIIQSRGEGLAPLVILDPDADAASAPGVLAHGGQVLALPLPRRVASALRSWPYTLQMTLFGVGLLIYLLSRLVGLTQFPIYFFSDEAIQTVAAADIVRDHLVDEEKVFLPTYFKNGPYYNLSVSVYLQILPYLFFGKSVFVTRLVPVLIGLLAAAAVGWTLRDFFKSPYWWAGPLLLSIAPAWFLHSRTAFETALFVAFYAIFLYVYLLYRYENPRSLYFAIAMAALAFYSYSPGQLVIGLTGLLLAIFDWRYHWQNRSVVLRGLGMVVLLALPYLRFRLSHPFVIADHLRTLGSYWVQPLSFSEKITRYISEYAYGLSPGYWFLPNQRDLPRHLMRGYGHLLRPTLPFAVAGLIIALKGIVYRPGPQAPAYRAVLIALLVAPAGSALVQIGITRALEYVIPATLLIALGISWLLTRFEERGLPHRVGAIGLFSILALVNFAMLRDVLVNAPTWYQDYGLGGMQYGARQLFPFIQDYLESHPDTEMIVSPSWANGTDVVARFFLDDPFPIRMGSIDGHLFQRLPLDENTLFVMTPEEHQKAEASGKFTNIRVEQSLPFPNGQPGFYFVRLDYVDDIDEILAVERAARRELQSAVVVIDGQAVPVRYSLLDMGEVGQMFDGDPETLGRTLEANPAVIELTFPELKPLRRIGVIIGSTQAEIKAILYSDPDSDPVQITRTFQGAIDHPKVTLDFGQMYLVKILRLEVRDTHQTEPANVHVWEIELE
jgi:4-amino-4-deoxy-L-arabinose transferase-like glycosyltransferase